MESMDYVGNHNSDSILRTKGEYLSNLVNLSVRKPHEDEYAEISQFRPEELKKRKLNYESVQNCFIQYGYTCYVCQWYKLLLQNVTIVIDKRDLDIPSEPLNIYIGYSVSSAQRQEYDLVELILRVYDRLFEDIQRFANPIDPSTSLFRQQLEKIKFIGVKGKNFVLGLEETELFRKYSMLLKVKNCSILNDIQVKGNIQLLNKAKGSVKEKIDQLNKRLREGQTSSTVELKALQEEIERQTKEFFRNLRVLKQETNVNQSAQEDPYLKMEVRFSEKEIAFERNLCEIVKVNSSQLGESPLVKFPEQELIVEYSCERSSICVKYVTQTQLNVENSDLLMFQFNNLSFDSSNVSLELYEKTIPPSNAKVRYLAFKATSWFARKEPPIEKILLLMDVAMITAKIIEPEITKPVYANRDFSKPVELHKKVSHYITILNFVAKKIYCPRDQPE